MSAGATNFSTNYDLDLRYNLSCLQLSLEQTPAGRFLRFMIFYLQRIVLSRVSALGPACFMRENNYSLICRVTLLPFYICQDSTNS